ncbi:unnamed protein product [Moneuplotes crassus]|uniref:Uncharacterized protein n=1 Tax=Euplotes crassus TaxID=5936 RepID=A0AAD1U743_EUPCR|nr:unnamed protein product [Moneuplotes crassus]
MKLISKGKALSKNKYKINSANTNSGGKSSSNSAQLFNSRNIKGPNNIGRGEFIIPAASTKSPGKTQSHIANKSIVFRKDGKSPYIHGDLEKLKQYVNLPKSNTRKTMKSALRTKYARTDTTEERKKIRDYSSAQNSILYKGSAKEMDDYIGKGYKGKLKHSKLGKHKHFMSYDAKSQDLKYYDFGIQNAPDNSFDRIHKKKKMSLSTKMKIKRNSSMSKMLKAHGFLSNTSTLVGYGGVNIKK